MLWKMVDNRIPWSEVKALAGFDLDAHGFTREGDLAPDSVVKGIILSLPMSTSSWKTWTSAAWTNVLVRALHHVLWFPVCVSPSARYV